MSIAEEKLKEMGNIDDILFDKDEVAYYGQSVEKESRKQERKECLLKEKLFLENDKITPIGIVFIRIEEIKKELKELDNA